MGAHVLTCTCLQECDNAFATPWQTPGWYVARRVLMSLLMLLLVVLG
jgi:hypothetical protein